MDPEKVLQAEKQAAADRVLIPSSYAINCVFFAIYLNSMSTWLDIVTELNIFVV